MQSALDVPGAIAIGIVFDCKATFFVNEAAARAVPHAEGGIDVRPE